MKHKYKILIHFIFWIYMINQTLFGIVLTADDKYKPFPDLLISYFSGILTFYFIYFSLGLIFTRSKKFLPVLILIIVLITLVPLRVGTEYSLWKWLGADGPTGEKHMLLSASWWYNSIRLVIIYGIYALLIQFAIRWYETQKFRSDLQLQNKASELALLRSQLRPHFLFNTLNNIYSLVYTRSDAAPEAVMRLSAIMRYLLYDATADEVPLEKEIEYLKSYIALENMRLQQKDFVELTISGSVEGRTIVPMIFIPFVENAYKHGSKNCPLPGIRIEIFIDPRWIQLEVINFLRGSDSGNTDLVQGIGLQNVRRRLELIYGQRFKLEVDRTKERFSVLLIIWE